MKDYGLIVATRREFSTVFNSSKDLHVIEVETVPFNVLKITVNENNIYAVLAGVGQTSAGAATQHLIDKYNVKVILNYGVVGALKDDLSVSSTVLIDKIIDYDFDAVEIGDEKIGWHKDCYPAQFIEADKSLIKLAQSIDPNLKAVTCASGNKFITDPKFKDKLSSEYGAEIVEMESAGIGLIAYRNQIPVLYVKGVSDSRTGGAAEFEKMIMESSKIAYELLIKIMKEI